MSRIRVWLAVLLLAVCLFPGCQKSRRSSAIDFHNSLIEGAKEHQVAFERYAAGLQLVMKDIRGGVNVFKQEAQAIEAVLRKLKADADQLEAPPEPAARKLRDAYVSYLTTVENSLRENTSSIIRLGENAELAPDERERRMKSSVLALTSQLSRAEQAFLAAQSEYAAHYDIPPPPKR